MSKHTEGPWNMQLRRTGGTRRWYIQSPNGVFADLQMSPVKTDPSEKQQANAALISAAPDLLAACQLALQFWYSDQPNDTPEAIVAKHAIREAVNKATGATP